MEVAGPLGTSLLLRLERGPGIALQAMQEEKALSSRGNGIGGWTPLRPLRGLQETRVAPRDESGVLGFPSRRGLTPREKVVADLHGLEMGSENAGVGLMEEVSWLESGMLEPELSDSALTCDDGV